MYMKGVKLYLAPTADARDTWQATLRHIALEGRCFVVGCNQYVTLDDYPEDLQDHDELAGKPRELCRGGSAVVGPLGEYIVEPLYGCEDILVCNLDLGLIPASQFDFDVAGHYSRSDVFQLTINEEKQDGIHWGEAKE
jgi:nitrilase